MGRPVLAADIGTTRQSAALVEPGGRILRAAQARTRPTWSGQQLWNSLTALLERAAGSTTPQAIAACCGGQLDGSTGTFHANETVAWRDFPLRSRLVERYPDVPVRVQRSAVCMAIGEHWRGAGRGRPNMLGMSVSTGVDAGLVLGGRLVAGAAGHAGEVGHVVVDPEGGACSCGGRGCLATIATAAALVGWATGHGWRPRGTEGSARDLASDAARGHPVAGAALRRAGRAIGVAVSSAEHLLDLGVVVVGGGLSQAGPLLFTPLEETVRAHTGLPHTRRLSVVPASLGKDAYLLGAAALFLAADRYWTGD